MKIPRLALAQATALMAAWYDAVERAVLSLWTSGTTAERPTKDLSIGQIRYNTTTDKWEGVADVSANVATWVSIGPADASGFSFLFGNAADGSATLDGSATVSWADGPSGNVYTLKRNVALENLTVNSGVALRTDSWALLVNGTLTNNGTIGNSGGNASGVTAGFGAGGATGGTPATPTVGARYLGIGQDGGTGAASSPGAMSAVDYLCGGAGGNGGNGSGGTGGTAPTGNLPPAAEGGLHMVGSFHTLATGQMVYGGSSFTLKPRGGSGGGGGAGSNTGGSGNASQGGGGGGGGGAVLIHARTIAGSGNVRARGGDGGNAVVTEGAGGAGAGGGGGGGGGLIFVITETANWQSLQTVSVAGGAGGTKLGTGVNGSAGSAGAVYEFIAGV